MKLGVELYVLYRWAERYFVKWLKSNIAKVFWQNFDKYLETRLGCAMSASYLQVWMSTVLTQVLQSTKQHQWNLQLHRSLTVTFCVLYPLPQHMRLQPSVPCEVRLQTLPWVPATYSSVTVRILSRATTIVTTKKKFDDIPNS